MSLQDDIFDVEAALEGKQELEQFEEIMQRFYALESEVEYLRKLYSAIASLSFALNDIEKHYGGNE